MGRLVGVWQQGGEACMAGAHAARIAAMMVGGVGERGLHGPPGGSVAAGGRGLLGRPSYCPHSCHDGGCEGPLSYLLPTSSDAELAALPLRVSRSV